MITGISHWKIVNSIKHKEGYINNFKFEYHNG